MYEDQTKNYDPEIHEEYLIWYTHHRATFIAMCSLQHSYKHN